MSFQLEAYFASGGPPTQWVYWNQRCMQIRNPRRAGQDPEARKETWGELWNQVGFRGLCLQAEGWNYREKSKWWIRKAWEAGPGPEIPVAGVICQGVEGTAPRKAQGHTAASSSGKDHSPFSHARPSMVARPSTHRLSFFGRQAWCRQPPALLLPGGQRLSELRNIYSYLLSSAETHCISCFECFI